jgi:hypothetical protein
MRAPLCVRAITKHMFHVPWYDLSCSAMQCFWKSWYCNMYYYIWHFQQWTSVWWTAHLCVTVAEARLRSGKSKHSYLHVGLYKKILYTGNFWNSVPLNDEGQPQPSVRGWSYNQPQPHFMLFNLDVAFALDSSSAFFFIAHFQLLVTTMFLRPTCTNGTRLMIAKRIGALTSSRGASSRGLSIFTDRYSVLSNDIAHATVKPFSFLGSEQWKTSI